MKRFEVGHSYEAYDFGTDPVMVIKRSSHFITVRNPLGNEWRMKVRECEGKNGSRFEIAVDGSAPAKWRECYTYAASFEHKEER